MQFHDFSLEGYDVSQFGTTIVLHLQRDAPGTGSELSDICFADVALYNFTHTVGAIITDIEECSLSDLLLEVGSRIVEWNDLYGIAQWSNSLGGYRKALLSQDYKAWRIESAIGFYGFVVAKSVTQIDAGIRNTGTGHA